MIYRKNLNIRLDCCGILWLNGTFLSMQKIPLQCIRMLVLYYILRFFCMYAYTNRLKDNLILHYRSIQSFNVFYMFSAKLIATSCMYHEWGNTWRYINFMFSENKNCYFIYYVIQALTHAQRWFLFSFKMHP